MDLSNGEEKAGFDLSELVKTYEKHTQNHLKGFGPGLTRTASVKHA